MQRQELEMSQKVFRSNHPSILSSMNNLAEVLQQQGKYEEAEVMQRQTVEEKQKVLGYEHPSTLHSMHSLTSLFGQQERFGEAVGLYQKVINGKQKVLGENHPDTLNAINDFATLQGECAKLMDVQDIGDVGFQTSIAIGGSSETPRMIARKW